MAGVDEVVTVFETHMPVSRDFRCPAICLNEGMTTDLSVPELLTPDEAAAALRVPRVTLRRWGAEGRVECVHLTPRTLRYTAESVRDLIENTTTKEQTDL